MPVPNPIDATGLTSVSDIAGSNIITADQTSGVPPLTVTASLGTDTIIGGGGDLIVDASLNSLAVEVAPATGGGTTINGGSGTLLVDPDDGGMEGPLTVYLADGAATINGSGGGTSIFAGTGDIQIIADGTLAITGNDGAETVQWAPVYPDVINVTTDVGTGITTLVDTGTGISVSLFGGEIIVDATAAAGTISDFANVLGTEVINLGAADVSVTAGLGSDSINAGLGNVTVDAGGNANPITVNGGGGSLEFSAGLGDATISGGTGVTIINGGIGTIALAQHELTMIRAGTGAITVAADGTMLSVTGEDGTSSTNWTVTAGDEVTITTDSATHATTLYDTVTGAQTVLANGYATNYLNAPLGGTINDLVDHNIITLMGPATVVASQGTDTINGGGLPGNITVDATGNTNPVVVNAGPMGALTFTAGDGPATVTGSFMGTTINGGNGDTTLNQQGATTIHAGNGTITVHSDGNPLTVFGADGVSNGIWPFLPGDTVTITTDSVTHVTTVTDPNGSLSYTLPAAVPPTVTIDPINGGVTLNADAAAMGLTVSGTTTGVEDGQTVTISVSNGIDPPLVYTPTVTGDLWSITIPAYVATGLIDGSHTVTANVSDLAGTPAVPVSLMLTVDETAPTVAIGSIAPVNAAALLAGFDISGTTNAEDNQVVTVSVWDGAAGGILVDAFTATVSGGLWSAHIPAGSVTELVDNGTYTVSADVADQAGNAAIRSLQTLTVDETPPLVTIVNAGGLTNHPVQTVSGTATEIGGTVTVWDGAATVGAATVGDDGHWTANVTLTGEGPHFVTAQETDLAGNTGTSSAVPYLLDTIAPMVTIDGPGVLTNQPMQTVTGTASEIGGTVTLLDGSTILGTATVAGDGSWSIGITLAGEATHVLTATQMDAAGNTGTSDPVLYTLDTTAPVVTITDLGGLTNLPGQLVSGTADPSVSGQTVTVWDGSSLLITTTVQPDGSWSIPVVLIGEGVHDLTASVTDLAGNTGTSAGVTYTLDLTPPTVTIASIDPVNAAMAAAGFTISGTTDAEDGQMVSVQLFNGLTLGPSYTAMVSDGAWSVTVPGSDHLADGGYTVTATVTDRAGNPALPASQTFAVDETAPMVTMTAPGGLTNLPVQVLSGVVLDPTDFGRTVTIWDGSVSVGTATVQVGGFWTTTAILTGDGSHSLTASVTDLAGNTGTSAPVTVTLDMTPPTVTIASIDPVNAAMAAAGFTISGTTDAENGRSVSVQILDSDLHPVGIPYAATVSNGAWSVTVPSSDHLADGGYTVTATVTDQAGNPALPASQTFTVDETVPAVTITNLGGLTNLAMQILSGTADPTELGRTVIIWDGDVSVGSGTVQLGGVWTATATLTGDAPHSLTATVTDAAGNTGTSDPVLYTLDTTAPVVTIDGLGGPTNLPGQLVSGTADPSVIGRAVAVWDGSSLLAVTTVQPDGSWSIPVLLTGEGAHGLTASVTDLAGNTGTSLPVTYTLDMTPPTVTIASIDTVNAAMAAAGFTISGTTDAEDGQMVSVQLFDGLPHGLPYTAMVSDGAWSVTVPSSDHLADGGYTVTATVTDRAGNPSLPATQAFTVDETVPAVTIDGLGALTNQPIQTVSGTATDLLGTVIVWDGATSVGSATVGLDGRWSTDVTLAGEGAHSLTAQETDDAGNVGSSDPVLYTLDTTAPAVTILGTGGLTNQANQIVAGTAEAGGTVIVWDGATSVASATVAGDGTWSAGVSLGSDGAHSLRATETDTAGNTGSSGSTVDYTLDTVAPVVAITSLGRSTNQPTQTVSGTAEAGGTVVVWDGITALGTTIAASDGSWSATVALSGNGQHSLIASETDGAGNTSISNAVSYMLDTSPVASGDNANPYSGAIGQRLADLLGSTGALSYFGPNQPIPDPSTGSPALLISGNDGTPVTVPGGVSVVRNLAAGVDLQGNGQADQVVVSSVGFTYHSNGGSGMVLADDAQAGGPAGNSNIVLARSGGGDFVISTGSGDDTVDAASGNVSVAAGGGHNMVWLGDGNALVTSSGADTVVSGSGAATVQATAGSQALVFGGGSTLSFIGGSGAATVVGGAGNTNLVAGSGDAVFWGSANGGNTMYAGTGAATLVGGGSGNVIHAAGSADLLIVAGAGNSTLVGGSATGNNLYWGSRGDDLISADQGNDTIIGGAGHDTVQAGGGNALIFGGVDGNTFVGGSGTANVVSGNGGANTFAFINGQAGGTEIIWGFRSGTDHLSLQGYGANELANATAGAQSYGGGTQIGLSDGTKIIFGDIATLSRTALS